MKQYVVDAFTDRLFAGNPAAVCLLAAWPGDTLMQSIAIENNLSETAFAVKEGDLWRLRWFTPGGEIDLCGHATLATAWVITNFGIMRHICGLTNKQKYALEAFGHRRTTQSRETEE